MVVTWLGFDMTGRRSQGSQRSVATAWVMPHMNTHGSGLSGRGTRCESDRIEDYRFDAHRRGRGTSRNCAQGLPAWAGLAERATRSG
jgi:hypothetical protein